MNGEKERNKSQIAASKTSFHNDDDMSCGYTIVAAQAGAIVCSRTHFALHNYLVIHFKWGYDAP